MHGQHINKMHFWNAAGVISVCDSHIIFDHYELPKICGAFIADIYERKLRIGEIGDQPPNDYEGVVISIPSDGGVYNYCFKHIFVSLCVDLCARKN